MNTVTLYRPVGPAELELIRTSGWKRFPPSLPGQPIFYPVENEAYARQNARDWNVKSDGEGHVLRISVQAEFLTRYPVQQVGNATHRERWIPADELDEFNDHIVAEIEVIVSYRAAAQ